MGSDTLVFLQTVLFATVPLILTRSSGLILVAIGFQMGFTGIEEFFGLESP